MFRQICSKRNISILTLGIVSLFSFMLVFADSENSVYESPDDLIIYQASAGFYELPNTASNVPRGAKTVDDLVMSLADMLVLEDNSSQAFGLSVYRIYDGGQMIHASVGAGNSLAYNVANLGVGEFIIIKTQNPYDCSELSLSQCKSQSTYISQKLFRVTVDGTDPLAKTFATTTQAASTTDQVSATTSPVIVVSDNTEPATTTLSLPFVEIGTSTDSEVLNSLETALSSSSENGALKVDADNSINGILSSLDATQETQAVTENIVPVAIETPLVATPESPSEVISQPINTEPATHNAEF